MKSYRLRCAIGDDNDIPALGQHRCRSPFSSGMNFWIVVNTTPQAASCSFCRRSAFPVDPELIQIVGVEDRAVEHLCLVDFRQRPPRLFWIVGRSGHFAAYPGLVKHSFEVG